MHVSLDGFVAGPNGEMDWIQVNEEIFDYVAKRISKGDTALYGRVTYEMMESYWPTAGNKPNASRHDIEHSRWYSRVHKIVLSNTLKNDALQNTEVISEHLERRIHEIKQSQDNGSHEILLFGSPRATHSLMHLNLIDGYWLFVNPVILGRGIPLFAHISEKVKLKLQAGTRQFDCGVTELSYEVDRS